MKAKMIWDGFNHPQKNTFAPGVFDFVYALKTQHRYVLLASATHGRFNQHHRSPNRLDPKTFPSLASIGNIYSLSHTHTLLPPKLLSKASPLFRYYSSQTELETPPFLELNAAFLDRFPTTLEHGKLMITESNYHGKELPLSLSYRPRRVSYTYKTQVLKGERLKSLMEKADQFEFEGAKITFATRLHHTPIQVAVTYPNTKFPTQEAFMHWMSWQTALLKARVYAKITKRYE